MNSGFSSKLIHPECIRVCFTTFEINTSVSSHSSAPRFRTFNMFCPGSSLYPTITTLRRLWPVIWLSIIYWISNEILLKFKPPISRSHLRCLHSRCNRKLKICFKGQKPAKIWRPLEKQCHWVRREETSKTYRPIYTKSMAGKIDRWRHFRSVAIQLLYMTVWYSILTDILTNVYTGNHCSCSTFGNFETSAPHVARCVDETVPKGTSLIQTV